MATIGVTICNRSLVLLGAGSISSLDDETDRALICRVSYPALRSAILSKHTWHFLNTKRELTRETSRPINEWAYSYVIPGGALAGAPNAVFFGPSGRLGERSYEIFGRRLYTDAERVIVDQVEDKPESEWPAYFQHLMVYALCAEIAFAVTDQQSVADNWMVRAYGTPQEAGFGGAFGEAMTLDAQGSPQPGIRADAFVNARAGSWGEAWDFTWPGPA